MRPEQTTKQLQRYFTRPKPIRPLLPWCILVLPILAVVGRLFMNLLRRSKFSDSDVDRMLEEAIARGAQIAERELFGMNPRQHDIANLVSLASPYLVRSEPTPAVPQRDMLARRGKDNEFRFSAYQFVYMYPTTHHLSLFATQYNFLYDAYDPGNEQEYPYRHIVSIEAGPVFAQVRRGKGRRTRKEDHSFMRGHWFRIVNAGGQIFEVGVSYTDLDYAVQEERLEKKIERGEAVGGLERLDSRFNDARKRIRDILRQKEEAAQLGARPPEWGRAVEGAVPIDGRDEPDWGPSVDDRPRI